jgi:hypothetical protein
MVGSSPATTSQLLLRLRADICLKCTAKLLEEAIASLQYFSDWRQEAAAQWATLRIGNLSVLDPDFWLGVQRFAPARVIGPVRGGVAGGLYEYDIQRRGDQEPDVFAEAIREYYSTSNRSKKAQSSN